MIHKPEAIIFDWDNTLIETWEIILISMNETLSFYNMPLISIKDMKSKIYKSIGDAFPKIFKENWLEAANLYRNSYISNSENNLKLISGSIELLKYIKDNTNIYTALVSNKSGNILRKEVKELNCEQYFKKIIGAGDAKEDKPSPIPIIFALEGTNIKPSLKTWYIGDTEGDMECAHNAHCQQVFFGSECNDSLLSKYQSILYFSNHQKLLINLKNFHL